MQAVSTALANPVPRMNPPRRGIHGGPGWRGQKGSGFGCAARATSLQHEHADHGGLRVPMCATSPGFSGQEVRGAFVRHVMPDSLQIKPCSKNGRGTIRTEGEAGWSEPR